MTRYIRRHAAKERSCQFDSIKLTPSALLGQSGISLFRIVFFNYSGLFSELSHVACDTHYNIMIFSWVNGEKMRQGRRQGVAPEVKGLTDATH